MFTKKGMGSIFGWAMLTLIAIFFSITRLIQHDPYYVILTIAVLMFLVLAYLLILRKIDGPSSKHELDDERLWRIAAFAQCISFWFLFISIWCLALIQEFFAPVFLKEYFSLFLVAIGTIAALIYMVYFAWHKYKV